MRIVIISLTPGGNRISDIISRNLEADKYSFIKYPSENSVSFERLSGIMGELFCNYEAIIFVCAVGIAVRCIAPYIKSKQSDPAVIAIDENGKFCISLLSGHIGGANRLTEVISELTGSVPVITTATDTGKKFSPDSFARANGLYIDNINTAKIIASEILKENKIGFYCEYPCINIPAELDENKNLKYGICISDNIRNIFEITLNLIPRKFIIGTGCKKNISPDIFENYILGMLEKSGISLNQIYCISTIDIKKSEQALIKFSRKYNIPLKFYSASELMRLEGDFSHSDFVMKITGADNICERCAFMDGNRLIVKKHSGDGVTFALSEREINIDFERKIF